VSGQRFKDEKLQMSDLWNHRRHNATLYHEPLDGDTGW
jgi:hypothetical protein